MSNGNLLNFILTDFENIAGILSTLTDSYRLFVGAAEELTRTPSASGDIIDNALDRTAFLGNIIDQILLILQLQLILDVIDEADQPKKNPFI